MNGFFLLNLTAYMENLIILILLLLTLCLPYVPGLRLLFVI